MGIDRHHDHYRRAGIGEGVVAMVAWPRNRVYSQQKVSWFDPILYRRVEGTVQYAYMKRGRSLSVVKIDGWQGRPQDAVRYRMDTRLLTFITTDQEPMLSISPVKISGMEPSLSRKGSK
jgi:hypothetical protein